MKKKIDNNCHFFYKNLTKMFCGHLVFWFLFTIFIIFLNSASIFAADKTPENNQTHHHTPLGNSILIQGSWAYNSYNTHFLPIKKKNSYGYMLEHQTRLSRTSELVFSIEQMWYKKDTDYMAHILWGYRFSWRYHIPAFMYKDSYSLYLNISWGIYDLWASGINTRIRTGAWSIGLGNRFYLGERVSLQMDTRIRNLQFNFPGQYPSREWIDSFYLSIGIGFRYISWKE